MQATRTQNRKPSNDYSALVAQYKEGFTKHYPNTVLEVKQGRNKDKEVVFKVFIDGSDGNRPLSVRDMQEAVQAFAR